jgi:CRISP-associated protein Cas1
MEIVVSSFGTSLRIVEGMLSIKWNNEMKQVPLGKIKTITLNRGIGISTDVIYQCLESGIDIILVERGGRPAGRLWNNKFGSISTIRKNQIDYSKNEPIIVNWVVENLKEKFSNQAELLYCFMAAHEPNETMIIQTVQRIHGLRERMDDYKSLATDEAGGKIRAMEGQVSKMYFACVNEHLPNQYKFTKRSKRPALDMINAMFNYCYGSLYAALETGLIKAGLDPFIGFFHRDEYNRPVLTYDVIEPFRPWADWVVFHLCSNEVLDTSFFEMEEGGYWMGGDGKRILIQHFADFFDEIIDYDGNHNSRRMHLEKRCFKIANILHEYGK